MDTICGALSLAAAFLLLHNVLFIGWLEVWRALASRRSTGARQGTVRSISVIVPAHDEERCMEPKLRDLEEALKGLPTAVEVLIGSDGSRDATVAIAKSFIERNALSTWHCFEFENEGKCQTINKLAARSMGDVIISTDADIRVSPSDIASMLRAFERDDRLGCVSCVPVCAGSEGGGQSLYWMYESAIRDGESRLGRLIVATGALYAYRRDLFRPIPKGVMADDLWIPLTVLLAGHTSRHEPAVRTNIELADDLTEARRRDRVIAGGMDVVRRLLPRLLAHPGLLALVFSHKINRWLAPLWALVLVLATSWIDFYWLTAPLLAAAALLAALDPWRFLPFTRHAVSPALSLARLAARKDLSKWDHTRA